MTECAYCTEEATSPCPLCHVGYCEECLKEHLELNENGIMLCPQQVLDQSNNPLVEHLNKVCGDYVSGRGTIDIGINDELNFKEGIE